MLLKQGKVGSLEEAESVARKSGGSLEVAARVLDGKLAEFQQTALTELTRARFEGTLFATRVNEFVDAAGKEAITRRRRLQNVLKFVMAFYRELFLHIDNPELRPTGTNAPFIKKALANETMNSESVLACVDRTLEALEQVDRNANLPFIVESWVYDIGAYTRTKR